MIIINQKVKKDSWKNVFKNGREIIFTTSTNDGRPNAIVVKSLGFIDDKLLIANCQMRSSLKNIQNNQNVCVVGIDEKEYYRFKGTASIFSSGKYFDAAVKESDPNPPVRSAIVIDIKDVFDLDKGEKKL